MILATFDEDGSGLDIEHDAPAAYQCKACLRLLYLAPCPRSVSPNAPFQHALNAPGGLKKACVPPVGCGMVRFTRV